VSDADLRELERRFRETGCVEDEAAWLRARAQAGELEKSRLELAAYCHHEAAVTALGLEALGEQRGFRRWANGLSAWGLEAYNRVQIAAAYAALVVWEGGPSTLRAAACLADMREDVLRGSPRQAVGAVEAWLHCPCPKHKEAASTRTLAFGVPRTRTSVAAALRSVVQLAWGVDRDEDSQRIEDDEKLLSFAEQATSPDIVRAAVRADLIPWALGYRDPVRERVEARQRAEAAGE